MKSSGIPYKVRRGPPLRRHSHSPPSPRLPARRPARSTRHGRAPHLPAPRPRPRPAAHRRPDPLLSCTHAPDRRRCLQQERLRRDHAVLVRHQRPVRVLPEGREGGPRGLQNAPRAAIAPRRVSTPARMRAPPTPGPHAGPPPRTQPSSRASRPPSSPPGCPPVHPLHRRRPEVRHPHRPAQERQVRGPQDLHQRPRRGCQARGRRQDPRGARGRRQEALSALHAPGRP